MPDDGQSQEVINTECYASPSEPFRVKLNIASTVEVNGFEHHEEVWSDRGKAEPFARQMTLFVDGSRYNSKYYTPGIWMVLTNYIRIIYSELASWSIFLLENLMVIH
jgi:hypothetical protein